MTSQNRAHEIGKRAMDISKTERNEFLVIEIDRYGEDRNLVEELLSMERDTSVLLPEQTSSTSLDQAKLR